MSAISYLFLALSVAATLYGLACAFRVLSTWIRLPSGSTRVLDRLTDPWLKLFKKARAFRFGALDFSPVVAIAALSLVALVSKMFADYSYVSLRVALFAVVSMVEGLVDMVLFFLALIVILRLAFSLSKGRKAGPDLSQLIQESLRGLDGLVLKTLFPGRIIDFKLHAAVELGFLAILWIACRALFWALGLACAALPF
jgi:uncharacterized protein YggT (Ycf19 family)